MYQVYFCFPLQDSFYNRHQIIQNFALYYVRSPIFQLDNHKSTDKKKSWHTKTTKLLNRERNYENATCTCTCNDFVCSTWVVTNSVFLLHLSSTQNQRTPSAGANRSRLHMNCVHSFRCTVSLTIQSNVHLHHSCIMIKHFKLHILSNFSHPHGANFVVKLVAPCQKFAATLYQHHLCDTSEYEQTIHTGLIAEWTVFFAHEGVNFSGLPACIWIV